MANIKQINVGGTTYDIKDAGATRTTVIPNDNGEIKTKHRIANKGYTGGGTTYWYYEICKLPKNDSGNYASAIISGRIGGWTSDNMSYISALIWNRGTPGLAVIDVGGTATAASAIWSICDLVLYTNSDGTATLYAKCANYFTFDLDLELFQSTASITYTGNKLTSVSGTLNKAASSTTSKMELINGELYVAGTKMSKSTHTHGYSGTTGANSGTAVTAVTGVGSNGTATALTGVKVSSSSSAAPGDHTHAYDKTTGVSLTANTSTATGRVTYVESISSTGASASGTASVGSETHTHSYTKPTGVSLGSNTTASGGVKYIEDVSHTAASVSGYGTAANDSHYHNFDYKTYSLSGSNSSHTTRYMKFSAGTTPVSSASPSHTSTNSGVNSGTGITVVTGVSGGSGSLTSDGTSTGGIAYIASHTAASLGTASTSSAAPGGHTHSYDKATGVSLSVASSEAPRGVRVLTDWATVAVGSSTHTHAVTVSGTTAAGSSSARTTVVTGSLSGTTLTLSTTTVPSNSHTHSYGSSTALKTNSPSSTTTVVNLCTADVIQASLDTTSTSSGTNSGTNFNAVTGYPNFSGGSGTTKYLHHTHTGASASGTNTAAPNSHTHTYDKTTSITLSRGTAPSMNFNTQSSSDNPYVYSATNSSLSLSSNTVTDTTGNVADLADTFGAVTSISGGSISKTTKYFHPSFTTESAATGGPSATTAVVTGVSGGTTSATTKYLSAAPSNSSTSTGANSGTNFNAATAVGSNGTATVLTGVKATGTASVSPSGHTHGYSGTTGTPQ